jgi:dolichol-phosphate mannosyltransferase
MLEQHPVRGLIRSNELMQSVAQSIVIIPTYNEHENLVPLVRQVLETAPDTDVLIVDDGSPDGTGALADGLAEADTRVNVIHRTGKQGLASAYREGFQHALERGYELITQMDADFSHRPEDLPRLLECAATADVVVGSRNVAGGRTEGWPRLRQFISRGGSIYTRTLLRLPIRDCTSGFKCIRRRALASIDIDNVSAAGYGFQVETNYLFHRAGM